MRLVNLDLATIGGRLAWWRHKRGLSLQEVCALLKNLDVDIAVPTLSQYEHNSVTPRLEKLLALANVYHVHPGILLPSKYPFKPALLRKATAEVQLAIELAKQQNPKITTADERAPA